MKSDNTARLAMLVNSC